MNGPRSMPPQRVPTLTEVVEPLYRAPAAPLAEAVEAAPSQALADPADPIDAPPDVEAVAAPAIDEAELIERVLGDLQRQVELMLEYRLREVLTPALVRATDALIRDARVELASTLRDVVARAVAVELSRHRGR